MQSVVDGPFCGGAALSVRRVLPAFAAALAIFWVMPRASASPLFELIGASTGTGGFNARVTGAGPASTYFNPALLSRADRQLSLGLVVVSDQIGMTLDGRTSGDVPLIVGGRTLVHSGDLTPISNQTVPTDWLQHGCYTNVCAPPFTPRPRQGQGSSGNTRGYAVIGFVDRVIEDRLVVGIYALVPTGDFTTAHSFYNDEREQFFTNSLHAELYSDRMNATSLSFGLGSRVIKRLSLGTSFTLSLLNQARSSTYVRESADYNKLLVSNNIDVRLKVAPHFGAVYDAFDWLHFAATVHTPQKFTVDTGISADLPDGKQSGTTRKEVYDYLPWTFGLGADVNVLRTRTDSVSIAGNVKYARWSDYIDRHGQSPADLQRGIGPADAADEFNWSNTFSETLGVRYGHGPVSTYLDVSYIPTPVPPQTGRSNYVDNDQVSGVLGAEYTIWVADMPLKIGLQTQVHRLIPRYQKKDDALIVDELPNDSIDYITRQPVPNAAGLQTNNPGWPGFASEGWILGGAISVALLY